MASDIRWNHCLQCKPLHIPNEATCEITAVWAHQRSTGHQRCCWSESESTIRLSNRRIVKYRLSRSSQERLRSLSGAASYPDNTAHSLVAATSVFCLCFDQSQIKNTFSSLSTRPYGVFVALYDIHAWLSSNLEDFSPFFFSPPMTFSDSQCQTSSNGSMQIS